uniref:Phosphotransbutyrylase n=1 Tax=Neomoorella thermoacetica TaxID=1525 RepID=Q76GN5_NEOTH|nr:phosphotransbutyrylase [Moorella thermoacetica]
MKLNTLIEKASQCQGRTVAVAAAEDEEVIEAVAMALEHRLDRFVLYGDRERIGRLLKEKGGARFADVDIVHTNSVAQAAELAVRAVHLNEADTLMKGHVPTATLLKAVLNKEYGLCTGKVLSHVAVFGVPAFERVIIVTDAGMNIAPDLEQKVQIVNNAASVGRSIGIERPKSAALAAAAKVNPAMPPAVDAAALAMIQKRGQIEHCLLDGPLALDNELSMPAPNHNRIETEVAGQPDILLVPDIESANMLYKSLGYFPKAKVGAVIAGAKAPIVLTSRADSAETKLYSLALAICSAAK